MILYGSTFSPFVRKVTAFAAERGIALEPKQIGRGDTDPAFRAVSPLGRMPALADGDFGITDSTAIVTYLDGIAPGDALIPADPRDRARVVGWDKFADTELSVVGIKLFYNRIVAPLLERRPDLADPAVADAAERDELPRLLDHLEGAVPDPGGFLVGGRLTLADIALASPLVNLAHSGPGIDAGLYPRLASWAAGMHARDSFAGTIAREVRTLAKVRGA